MNTQETSGQEETTKVKITVEGNGDEPIERVLDLPKPLADELLSPPNDGKEELEEQLIHAAQTWHDMADISELKALLAAAEGRGYEGAKIFEFNKGFERGKVVAKQETIAKVVEVLEKDIPNIHEQTFEGGLRATTDLAKFKASLIKRIKEF